MLTEFQCFFFFFGGGASSHALLLAQGSVCFSGKPGSMLQLLLPRMPPGTDDVVSSQGPGELDTGKLQGTEWPLLLYFELAVFWIHGFT